MNTLGEHAGSGDANLELVDLRQQVEKLRQAVRARDDFIAIAAHELRNPMTPLLGLATLALTAARDAGYVCPPRLTTLLERMQLATEDFLARATRLLDVSRIAAGNMRLEPSGTDLSALVRSTVQKYEVAAARAHPDRARHPGRRHRRIGSARSRTGDGEPAFKRSQVRRGKTPRCAAQIPRRFGQFGATAAAFPRLA